jgi:hypothetical protein
MPDRVFVLLLVGILFVGACSPDSSATTTQAGPSDRTQFTVSLEGLVRLTGLAIDAWVVPVVGKESVVLGQANFQNLGDNPSTVSGVIRPERFGAPDDAGKFPPGEYRLIIEAYIPSGDMRYGCERQIVAQSKLASATLILTSIPVYTGNSLSWTGDCDTLGYPHCPMWP